MKLLALVLFFCMLIWLNFRGDGRKWTDSIPTDLSGTWTQVGIRDLRTQGIVSIGMKPSRLKIAKVDGDGVESNEEFPVQRVALTDEGSECGRLVIFYGLPNSDHIAEHRMEIAFGPKLKIEAWEILATGYGDDRWIELGEFVRNP
jgi:hypothetical protein